MQENERIKNIGDYGAILALMEVGSGSLIHGLNLPFGGHFLSLNQGYLLSRATLKTQDPSIVVPVSNIAAVLKSFSPAGKKFGPMVSLSIQGLLFRAGLFLGVNPLGILLGMLLLSLWGFVQPFVTFYLLFGKTLILAASFWVKEILQYFSAGEEDLIPLIIGVVILKGLLAMGLGLLAYQRRHDGMAIEGSMREVPKPVKGSPLLLAMKDMTKPLFLFSLLLTGIFIYFTQHEWTQVIWYLLRPIGIGFIFFYFSRTLTLDRLILRLQGGSFESFGKGLEIALRKVRQIL